ncbi:hypothetical protein DM02DRAFT_654884 [Periconia macrospinosa]|uniref:Rhodopsin domain-containing protein n=1 Tax=Periconia macrospinosa TaxID=97972 RepID=A0A2V1DRT9_9PLEO|nr:hypothetical protein DM02DRAFT_654884 [Periconia macrospinosa]
MESALRPAPPGFTSNFAHSASLGLPVVILAGICLLLVLLFAFTHVYARVLVNKWIFHDYIYCLSCLLGVVYIAFSIPLGLAEPFGKHVWDIKTTTLTKTYMSLLHAFTISTGPMLWLTKLVIFTFITRIFNAPRWYKNSTYVGTILTGLLFSQYTCTVVLACGPKPEDDVKSYINGFRTKACSSPDGVHMVTGITTGIFNCLTNLYLLSAAIVLRNALKESTRNSKSTYAIYASGLFVFICSFVTMIYKIKSWQDSDITGYQVVLDFTIILEVVLSLLIPAMPSIYEIWKFYTHVEIIERTTIGTPNTIWLTSRSNLSTGPSTPAPSHDARSWRKTHLSIEELPYRRPSFEYYRSSTLKPLDTRRMKALPATPLPALKTPNSVKSMRLPILLERE